MLYIKGRINSVSYKEPEGKKPFYNVQFSEKNEEGTVFTTWCRIYSKTKIETGKELEVQVKATIWENKVYITGFIK